MTKQTSKKSGTKKSAKGTPTRKSLRQPAKSQGSPTEVEEITRSPDGHLSTTPVPNSGSASSQSPPQELEDSSISEEPSSPQEDSAPVATSPTTEERTASPVQQEGTVLEESSPQREPEDLTSPSIPSGETPGPVGLIPRRTAPDEPPISPPHRSEEEVREEAAKALQTRHARVSAECDEAFNSTLTRGRTPDDDVWFTQKPVKLGNTNLGIYVIKTTSSRYTRHHYFMDDGSRDHEQIFSDCLDAFVFQRQLCEAYGSSQVIKEARDSLTTFGQWVVRSIGNGRKWKRVLSEMRRRTSITNYEYNSIVTSQPRSETLALQTRLSSKDHYSATFHFMGRDKWSRDEWKRQLDCSAIRPRQERPARDSRTGAPSPRRPNNEWGCGDNWESEHRYYPYDKRFDSVWGDVREWPSAAIPRHWRDERTGEILPCSGERSYEPPSPRHRSRSDPPPPERHRERDSRERNPPSAPEARAPSPPRAPPLTMDNMFRLSDTEDDPTTWEFPDREAARAATVTQDGALARAKTVTEAAANPATLVKALALPLSTEFMTPNTAGWKGVIRYLQEAESQHSDPRIDSWSKRTRQSIDSIWIISAPEEYRERSDYKPSSWRTMSKTQLIAWMEDQQKAKMTNFDREDRVTQLRTQILDNPMSIDFLDRNNVFNCNSLLKAYNILSEALLTFEEAGETLTQEEERDATKMVWDRIKIEGLHEPSLEAAKAKIKKSCFSSSASGTPARLQQLMIATLKTVSDLLQQRTYNDQTFKTSSSSSSSSTHQSKSASNKPKEEEHKRDKSKGNKKRASSPTRGSSDKRAKSQDNKCYGCGYSRVKDSSGRLSCPRKVDGTSEKGCRNDPRHSDERKPFLESTIGKQWAKAGYNSIPQNSKITLSNCAEYKTTHPKGTHLLTVQSSKLLQHELISFAPTQEDPPSGKRKRKATAPPPVGKLLLDTGALGSNVMSMDYAKRLRKHKDCYTASAAKHSIETAAKNKLTSNKIINMKINLGIEGDQPAAKPVDISAAVAPIGVDLIIDRDTIRDNNLTQRFPTHFAKGELLERIQMLPIACNPMIRPSPNPMTPIESEANLYATMDTINTNPSWEGWDQLRRIETRRNSPSLFRDLLAARMEREQALTEEPPPMEPFVAELTAKPYKRKKKKKGTRSQQRRKRRRAAPVLTKRQKKFIAAIFLSSLKSENTGTSNFSDKNPYEREGAVGLDEIPEHKLESIPADLLKAIQEHHEYKKVNIRGPKELIDKLRKLIAEFKSIFKATVQSTPSTAFEPFNLKVDDDKWMRPCNATPPRQLGQVKEKALDEILEILIKKDIIEDCTDSYYSHAFLTPKRNGSWRLVLDFKGLNRATTSKYEWPIPNIKDMLNRVGESRPEFFAVFDLTSGYYQAPIAEEARKYTAFKTRKGVYRWKRLPMGLTDAGSYFQHQLTTKVLAGLIHNTCELYLDDCMVYASNVDEYLERLRQVFLRFREHKITLNPSKCHLGLSQVEYVGHTIDKNGLHFTRDKLDSVLNFPRPETMKNVKSFIGLANYFRDHIRDHSLRVQALQDLVEGYSKQKAKTKVNWTPECDAAFQDIRQAIDECPLLWFVDDHSPIFLKTDASDYGIGAYLYQVVTEADGKEVEKPIGFISKSLVSGHDSWDIPMKEGFAIYYALRKWEYLLRDRKFTILTDHENLTRLRTERSANKMVTRWFMAYQDYDIIAWIHVKGIHNEVPDSFSRLCSNNSKGPTSDEDHTALLFQLEGYEMDTSKWETIRTKAHSTESGHGHGGVSRTITVLDEQGLYWPGRSKDVRRFIKMCPCCQKMNLIKPVVHSYPFTLSTYGLFQTVSVDLIEKLKVDDYGASMVVVIIDNFSRFVDLYPISDTSAEAAADALIQFTGRFKTPIRFTTDSGSNFKSVLMEGLMSRLGADHQLTKAYSKEQNAVVERVNKEVLSQLRSIIFDKRIQRRWSKYLPIVQRVLNTSVHSATGCTPAEVVFPDGAEIDKELFTNTHGLVVSAYIRDMQEAQGKIIALAELNLRKRDAAYKDSRQGEEPVYNVGEYILAEHRHNSLRKGPKSKLLPYLAGPYVVTEKGSEGMYVVRDLISMRQKDYHVSRLRPFLYDERTLQPAEVAARDALDEFIVEKVVDFKGNPRGKKANLYFKCRWAGYGPADDTWVAWKDCRTTTAVQVYLYHHPDKRLRYLVMKGFDPEKIDDNGDSGSEYDSD